MTRGLIEIEDARDAVLECAHALAHEDVELRDALGRVLARDTTSTTRVPPFDNSAMDGFAVRCTDVRTAAPCNPVKLEVVGESRAGHAASAAVATGEAIAISTGAMLPPGADAVVAVEQTRLHEGQVEILAGPRPGEYVRRAGDDIEAGQMVLARGTQVGPSQLGVLASLGVQQVACVRRPGVSIVTAGDELLGLGQRPRPGSIYDSNAFSLAALACRAGARVQPPATVPDDADSTMETIEQTLPNADVLVLCGGVSVGRHDHVRPALQKLGVRQRFWGVALKPGKPTWFGTLDDKLVFGLPGNPVSAMVTFILFVAPAVRVLGGASASRRTTLATMARDYRKPPGRAHAVRCRLALGESGWRAEPTGDQGSHVLTSMLDADALALIPAASELVKAGDRVEIELLEQSPWVFA